jgi:hypothetical protein
MPQDTEGACGTEPRKWRLSPNQPKSAGWEAWDQQLAADDPARLVMAALPRLDLGPLRESYAGRGSLPYCPELMLVMVLIEKQRGRASPSQWHGDQRDSVALLWAGQGIQPSRSVWYAFRDRIAPFLEDWNATVLRYAVESGYTDASEGATDGTLIAAAASRHRLVNQQQITSRLEELDTACQQDLRQDPVAKKSWMANTPSGRLQQVKRYQRAQGALQLRLAANARKRPSDRLPEKRVVISVSDPEAALGPDKFKVFRPLYDTLLLVDRQSPLILGYDVFAHSQDTALLVPILERTRQLTGRMPHRVAADAGFITGMNLAQCSALSVELIGPWKENDFSAARREPATLFTKDEFVWQPDDRSYQCPAGERLARIGSETRQRAGDQVEHYDRFATKKGICSACSLRAKCTTGQHGRQLRRSEHEELILAHRNKMATDQAKAISKTRGQIVERAFADLKEHRQLRSHTGRKLTRAKTDVALAVLIHNLLTVHKADAKRTSLKARETPQPAQ